MLNLSTMTTENRKKYDAVKAKFEGHFIIKRNVVFQCTKFNLKVQKENEPVDSFTTEFYFGKAL